MEVILREEIFGATIFYSRIGKKFFISKDEFENVVSNNVFPKDCIFNSKPSISRIIG